MSDLNEYYAALERLVRGQPVNVSNSSKINRDTVALEAGRKRGAIKKSRESFAGLIFDIDNASNQFKPRDAKLAGSLRKTKAELKAMKLKYLNSLNREIMLSNRIAELETIIESDNVSTLNKK